MILKMIMTMINDISDNNYDNDNENNTTLTVVIFA